MVIPHPRVKNASEGLLRGCVYKLIGWPINFDEKQQLIYLFIC
jgi:hypothetical protein